jgi:hypothetical protein
MRAKPTETPFRQPTAREIETNQNCICDVIRDAIACLSGVSCVLVISRRRVFSARLELTVKYQGTKVDICTVVVVNNEAQTSFRPS